MARVSKDKDSWAAGGVLRRDFRQDKSVDGVSGAGRKKNTKKWCKGKEGRPHVPVWTEAKGNYSWAKEHPIMEVSCERCGKVFETDYGFFGRPKKGREALLAKWVAKLNS